MKIQFVPLWRISKGFLFAIVIGAILIAVALLSAIFIVYAHINDAASLPADCAIVFGAAVYGNQYPGPAIVRRVARAAELYRSGSVHRLILSGGRGSGNLLSEAAAMRKEAVSHGVADKDITLEVRSHSTWENLLYSRDLTTQCNSVIGISDGYHLARIKLLAWRLGYGDFSVLAAGDRPDAESERKSVLREAFGYLYYFFHIDLMIPESSLDTLKNKPEQGSVRIEVPKNALAPILSFV